MVDRLQRACSIVICRGCKDITGESASILAAEEPLALRITERSIAWLLRTGKRVPYWRHLQEVEKIDNTLIHNGEDVTLKEACQIWADDTLHKWEEEWGAHQLSKWTHFLFTTVEKRLDLKGFVPTFWSTQAITGHGVFRG